MFDDPRPEQPLPRGPTSQPYRGPSRVRRSDGRREIWVEGQGYVPEQSLAVLPPDERRSVLEARSAATEAQSVVPDLDRFMELNRTNRTGSLFDLVGGAWNARPMWDEGMQEMHSITDRLAPLMRRPGSGASSNLDVEMFRSGLPNIRRGGNPNARIAGQLRMNAGDLQDYAEFLEWYAGRNQTTSGALEQFNQYRALGRPGQRPPWRQHFGAGGQQRAAPTQRPAPQTTRPPQRQPAEGGTEEWVRDPASGRLVRRR